jgi:dehydrogenase/reductase SDR family member 12
VSAAGAVDAALEASVVGSFTRIGYTARKRLYHWTPLADLRLDGKIAVVTGATSGLGLTAAGDLVRQGAAVCIVGRHLDRTESARARIAAETGVTVEAELADLSVLAEVRSFIDRFSGTHDRLDVLVHNAGALTHEHVVTEEGNEITFATQVLTPFLLTRALLPLLEAGAPSRVILVASGGAYSERLDVAGLEPGPGSYDGVKAYARCKRAQIALAGEWARRLKGKQVTVNAMHPGWADTPGIRDALPRFSRVLGPLLRTPAEGADTIAWLAAAPEAADAGGGFFLDRRARSLHRLSRTRRQDEQAEAQRLWDLCSARTL